MVCELCAERKVSLTLYDVSFIEWTGHAWRHCTQINGGHHIYADLDELAGAGQVDEAMYDKQIRVRYHHDITTISSRYDI